MNAKWLLIYQYHFRQTNFKITLSYQQNLSSLPIIAQLLLRQSGRATGYYALWNNQEVLSFEFVSLDIYCLLVAYFTWHITSRMIPLVIYSIWFDLGHMVASTVSFNSVSLYG